jgi:hypothetical protein
LLAVLVTAAIVGCQPSVGATATGAVTFNGKPAPAGVMVTFQPQVTNSSASIGVTDATGRYDLRFNARQSRPFWHSNMKHSNQTQVDDYDKLKLDDLLDAEHLGVYRTDPGLQRQTCNVRQLSTTSPDAGSKRLTVSSSGSAPKCCPPSTRPARTL